MMTNEERQKLVASLRIYEHIGGLGPMCRNAADEIERLAAQLKLVEETMRGLQVAFERGHNYD